MCGGCIIGATKQGVILLGVDIMDDTLIYTILTIVIASIIVIIIYNNKKEQEEIERYERRKELDRIFEKQREEEQKRKMEFLSGFTEWSAKEFLNKKSTLGEMTGVYIIYNKSKNMYYVGQSVKTVQRVNSHLSGRGNGDVYADYKYGDEFTVKIIPLNKSGYDTLDDLERNMINTYNAYSSGYNKTRGNR